jgi:hypothetical protein
MSKNDPDFEAREFRLKGQDKMFCFFYDALFCIISSFHVVEVRLSKQLGDLRLLRDHKILCQENSASLTGDLQDLYWEFSFARKMKFAKWGKLESGRHNFFCCNT